jgi:hypothetical protein
MSNYPKMLYQLQNLFSGETEVNGENEQQGKLIPGAILSIKKNCHAGHQKYCGLHWIEKSFKSKMQNK